MASIVFPEYDSAISFRATKRSNVVTVSQCDFDERVSAIRRTMRKRRTLATVKPSVGRKSEAILPFYQWKTFFCKLPSYKFNNYSCECLCDFFMCEYRVPARVARRMYDSIVVERMRRVNVADRKRKARMLEEHVKNNSLHAFLYDKRVFVAYVCEQYSVTENAARRIFNSIAQSRVNAFSLLRDYDGRDVPSCVDEGPSPVFVRRQKKDLRMRSDECQGSDVGIERDEDRVPFVRDTFLAGVLRSKIVLMRIARLPARDRCWMMEKRETFLRNILQQLSDPAVINDFLKEDLNDGDLVHVEMDVAAHGNTEGQLNVASNVVIEEESDELVIRESSYYQDWTDACTNDVIVTAPNLTDRWFPLVNFQWHKNQDDVIQRLHLPHDIIVSADSKDLPNIIPFKISSFSHFDSMEIKFLLNSNKFQTGCLGAAFVYQTDPDLFSELRANKYSLSQVSHVKMYPATMNEASLVVPYRNSLSMLYNQPNVRVEKPLELGTLYMFVINPLAVGTNVSSVVNINVEVKFNNLKFTGTRPADWPQVEMETIGTLIAANAAMTLLNTVMPDPNRDNPPLNAESTYVVPTASHSWSAGTGRVEPTKILRLDTRGQTPHPIGSEDAFTVSNLASKSGLLTILDVNITTAHGTLMYHVPVEPMFGSTASHEDSNYEIRRFYRYPPVSVISSCFNLWRGSFIFSLDIVASQFQTCKLICAYIPNVPAGKTPTLKDIRAAHNWIISVEGPKSVELEIPYIANQPWWPRSYTGNFSSVAAAAPSKFYIFMLNPPLLQNSSADKFYINIYVRAGPSFEVAIPVQPALGLSWNKYFKSLSSTLYPINPIAPHTHRSYIVAYYAKSQEYIGQGLPILGIIDLNNKNKLIAPISYPMNQYFKYNPNNSRAGIPIVGRRVNIAVISDVTNSFSYSWKNGNKTEWLPTVYYGQLLLTHSADGKLTHWVFVPCPDRPSAYKMGDKIQTNNDLKYESLKPFMLFPNYPSGTSTDNYTFLNTKDLVDNDLRLDFKLSVESNRLESVVVEAGDREGYPAQTISNVKLLRPTNFGMLNFGENFNDLLNLCRRYQQYGIIKMTKSMLSDVDKCSFFFTANPIGLMDKADNSPYNDRDLFTRCREGPIPLLLSGYRYFRGGLRFRLVFPACKDTLIWIQHRSDRPSNPMTLQACTTVESAQALMNHGYATEIQLANINSIVEFEVPFYQYDAYGLLQVPPYPSSAGVAYDYQFGLGQVMVGIRCSKEDSALFTDRYCEIFYSLADDFSPSLFYGFPPTIMLDELPAPINPDSLQLPMLPALSISDTPASSSDGESNSSFEAVESPHVESDVEGVPAPSSEKKKSFFDIVNPFKKANNFVADKVTSAVQESITTQCAPLVQQAKEEMAKTLKGFSMSNGFKENILLLFTNIAHSIASMSFQSIAISIISMFIGFGMIAYNYIDKGITIVKNIVTRLFSNFSTAKPDPAPPTSATSSTATGSTTTSVPSTSAAATTSSSASTSTTNTSQPSPDATQHTNSSERKGVHVQAPDDNDSLIASWLSLLFGGISTLFNYKNNSPFESGRATSNFFKDFSFSMRGAQGLYVFVKNSMQAIKHFFNYICTRCDPHYRVLVNLSEDKNIISKWLKEVIFLTDPSSFTDNFMENDYVDRVYIAYDYGQLYISQLSGESITPSLFNQINKLFFKLQEVKSKLLNMGKHPHIRKEPFGVYVYGAAGIGKSQLREELCVEMLKSDNFKFKNTNVFCVVDGGEKFWDHCEHQPVLVFDDLWNIQEGERFFNQIGMMYRVFSDVVLIPPKADLADKGMRYNPEIVWISSNYTHINANNINTEALNRRRNFCIEALASTDEDGIVEGCPHCANRSIKLDTIPAKWLKDYHHVRFYVHTLTADRKFVPTEHTRGERIDFNQLKEMLCEAFKLNRRNEAQKFETKYQRLLHVVNSTNPKDAPSAFFLTENDLQNKTFAQQLDAYRQAQHKILEQMKKDYDKSFVAWCERFWCDITSVDFKKFVPAKMVNVYEEYKEKLEEARKQGLKDSASGLSLLDENADLDEVGCEAPDTLAFEATFDFSVAPSSDNVKKLDIKSFKTYLGSPDSNNFFKTKWFCFLSGEQQIECLDWAFQKFNTRRKILDLKLDCNDNVQCFFYIILSTRMNGHNWKKELSTFIGKYYRLDMFFLNWVMLMYKENGFGGEVDISSFASFLNTIGTGKCLHDPRYIQHVLLKNRKFVYSPLSSAYPMRLEECDMTSVVCPCLSETLRRYYLLRWYLYNPKVFKEYNMNNANAVPIGFESDETFVISEKWYESAMRYYKNFWAKTLSPAISKVYHFIVKHVPIILMLFSLLCTTVFVGTSVYDARVYYKSQGADSPLWVSGVAEGPYSHTQITGRPTSVHHPAVQSSQQSEAVIKIIRNNTFYLSICDNTTMRIYRYRCLGIHGHFALMLRHYVDNIKDKIRCVGTTNLTIAVEYNHNCVLTGSRTIQLDNDAFLASCKFFKHKAPEFYSEDQFNAHQSNFVVFKVPSQCLSFKSLLKFFPSQAEVNQASTTLRLVNEKDNMELYGKLKSHKVGGLYIPPVHKENAYNDAVTMASYWEYGVHGRGMCGSVLVSNNLQNPIVGMHVAGCDNAIKGYSELIVKEMFDFIVREKRPEKRQVFKLEDVSYDDIEFESAIYVHGKVSKQEANIISRKSRITPTLLHGEFPVTTAPNPLSASDPRLPEPIDPLISGVNKHGLFTLDFDEKLLDRCKEHLSNHLISVVKPILSVPRFLTLDESVCGSPVLPHVDPLNWQTSAGFPLKQYKPSHESGKKWLFNIKSENNQNYVESLHPKLESLLSLQRSMRNRNYQPITVFSDCLKDTCIPIEKCSIPGKTRIFSISPIQYTIAFKEAFGLYMASYRNTRFNAFHAIGVNPVSPEWASLKEYLCEVGTKFVTGDYSNFGPGLNLGVASAAMDIIIDWNKYYISDLTHEQLNTMICLKHELIDRYHLCNNLVYTPGAGLPSGSPATDILNSMVNNLYLMYAWLKLTNHSLLAFDENVRMVVYGDDVIMCVSDKYIPIFNSSTISELFKSYNIKFTDQSKTGEIVPFRSLDTCTFLKSYFVPHPFRPPFYLAKIELDSVHSCLNWNKGTLSTRESTATNAKQSLELLYCHGPEVYDQYRKKILALLSIHNLTVVLPTWRELDSRIFDDGYNIYQNSFLKTI
ncbi:polyprotein [Nilaparvata lugens honeydew virus-3]|uniref:polyprotein n=1 Tax=Nilaparvata lugens honeydew virus-3 TaxID=1345662 RepID=UPI0003508339|nr:polyprotein [Nilaparvata lugens honeydew virus-3]BAN57353.1 polyprotein [Nilaparvata lugens honeydew virus-3]